MQKPAQFAWYVVIAAPLDAIVDFVEDDDIGALQITNLIKSLAERFWTEPRVGLSLGFIRREIA